MMKMKLPLPVAPANKKIGRKQPQKKNIAKLNQTLESASKAFSIAIAKENFQEAYQHILSAYKLVPEHPELLMDLGYTELKMKKYDQAYRHYQKAIQCSGAVVNTNIYDGLAEVCHFMEKTEDLIKYGALALSSKKKQVEQEPVFATIPGKPTAFNPDNKQENIIAFSLFDNLARYCETSLINIELANEIYPSWTCRFYVDNSVPLEIQQRLAQKGAQVVQVTPSQQELSGLFWRFLVMDDPTVKRFLIRDADSLVSWRERAAVDQWLASDCWFHTMRDFYSHTELILAGMWGGCRGVFNHIEQHIRDYVATGRYLTLRVMDQHYLRYCIWPTVQQSVMMHDSQQFDPQGVPFPPATQQMDYEDLQHFHVGMNEGSAQFELEVQLSDDQVMWNLLDAQEQLVCRYVVQVPASRQIKVDIPRHYAKKIQTKEWKIRISPVAKVD